MLSEPSRVHDTQEVFKVCQTDGPTDKFHTELWGPPGAARWAKPKEASCLDLAQENWCLHTEQWRKPKTMTRTGSCQKGPHTFKPCHHLFLLPTHISPFLKEAALSMLPWQHVPQLLVPRDKKVDTCPRTPSFSFHSVYMKLFFFPSPPPPSPSSFFKSPAYSLFPSLSNVPGKLKFFLSWLDEFQVCVALKETLRNRPSILVAAQRASPPKPALFENIFISGRWT